MNRLVRSSRALASTVLRKVRKRPDLAAAIAAACCSFVVFFGVSADWRSVALAGLVSVAAFPLAKRAVRIRPYGDVDVVLVSALAAIAAALALFARTGAALASVEVALFALGSAGAARLAFGRSAAAWSGVLVAASVVVPGALALTGPTDPRIALATLALLAPVAGALLTRITPGGAVRLAGAALLVSAASIAVNTEKPPTSDLDAGPLLVDAGPLAE